MRPEIRDLIASVARPYRYAGGEVGARAKGWDDADVRFCLVFPDAYEIGMSHLGVCILYHLLNSEEGVLADRCFSPWPDMEEGLRGRGIGLFSLESQRTLREFDVVGVSLAYELTYTNALAALELGGVPLRSSDRGDGDPVVVAGGPCAFNPMPVAPFFDAIVIGDGERAAVEIARAVRELRAERSKVKGSIQDRAGLLEALSAIRGVYVPAIHDADGARPPGMARVEDLDAIPFPARQVVAHAATQERAAVEAARGCTRGCRFCQAGYTYRPQRQRSGAAAASIACEAIEAGGKEEFSFLSLSIGDWPPLEGALEAVQRDCALSVDATLPSLRVESLTPRVVASMGSARAGSFTLAPEAATERMRRFVNKGNTDDDLYSSVEKVFAGGFSAVKLYFMIGLPGETEAEIEGIERVARRCLAIGRKHHRRPTVTVSTSTFVPKAHTPLQWEGQISIEETERIQRRLKRTLRGPGLEYRWHSARMSFLEGVFSRGGGELADAIEIAMKKGARFDGWDERLDIALWMDAFAEAGIDPNRYLEARPDDCVFPWEGLGAGPSRDFLERERRRAAALFATEDCAGGACSACGICDPKRGLVNRITPVTRDSLLVTGGQSQISGPELPVTSHRSPVTVFRYRIRFSKIGRAAFLGHLEALDALRRGFRASRLPLTYSQGFHPRARIAAGPAVPVGVESLVEFADVELAVERDAVEIVKSMKGRLPEGMAVLDAVRIDGSHPSIEESTHRTMYEAATSSLPVGWEAALGLFASDKPLPFSRVRKEISLAVDLREYVDELAVSESGVLRLTLNSRRPALKVSEVLQGVFGIPEDQARRLEVRKVSVDWKQ
ncbi:MAG: TIGR03960 family B12-binding radical SAM protein [Proteobacteria bacterium]|nr:TIGR03960 family B12-binding radical SAM protein [Pseudomonadota bacterium]